MSPTPPTPYPDADVDADPSVPANEEIANFALGQTLDTVLALIPVLATPFGGDVTRALVFFAMARASVSHLNHHHKIRPEASNGVFPDSMRRPVSVLSISSFLGLPYETTRRHVHALANDGWCERLEAGGFSIRAETLAGDRLAGVRKGGLSATRDYVARLHNLITSDPGR